MLNLNECKRIEHLFKSSVLLNSWIKYYPIDPNTFIEVFKYSKKETVNVNAWDSRFI